MELKERLGGLGWSYAEAARQLGVSRGTISRWIRGERRIPQTAIRLIDMLERGRTLRQRSKPAIAETAHLSPFERDLLGKLVSHLSTIRGVDRIMVFGSRARGLSSDQSDLDVAVVTNRVDPFCRSAVEQAKWRALPEDAFLYANVVTISGEDLAADSAFSRSLSREGVEIWSRSERAK
ncbi:MAG: helix-turn-helix domain-containing protein [Thermodesulfobacteriota bacterium]